MSQLCEHWDLELRKVDGNYTCYGAERCREFTEAQGARLQRIFLQGYDYDLKKDGRSAVGAERYGL